MRISHLFFHINLETYIILQIIDEMIKEQYIILFQRLVKINRKFIRTHISIPQALNDVIKESLKRCYQRISEKMYLYQYTN